MDDAPTFAQELHYSSRIRTHTVAISDEEALAKYEPRHRGSVALTPNRRLLERVSENSHGNFFPSPDAATLTKLFDELGEGVLYPLV